MGKAKNSKQKRGPAIFKFTALVFAGFLLCLVLFNLLFWARVYPGVKVGGINLTGKTEKQANLLLQEIEKPRELIVLNGGQKFTISREELKLSYNPDSSTKYALLIGRKGSLPERVTILWQGLTGKVNIPLQYEINEAVLDKWVSDIEEEVNIPQIPPKITIQKGKVLVEPGKDGRSINRELFKEKVNESLGKADKDPLEIPFTITHALTKEEIKTLEVRAEKFIGAQITFEFEFEKFVFSDNDLVSFLAADNNYKDEEVEAVRDQISTIERNPQDAAFRFKEGRVLEFRPAKDGVALDREKLREQLVNALENIEKDETDKKQYVFTIPVKKTSPKITTDKVNSLGIKELIGRGSSRFRGSILSRAHNITVAASRLNGILVPPGETFSFNRALGDVSAFTGYQQAYIIRDGKTILGDGGGVCQVSTTLFRAALAAGLPIAERRAHSYRVSYYEQDSGPGFDATVYDPTTDLKIKNDTPGHILVQTSFDKKSLALTFELYGTSDGRVATTTKPRVWDQVTPPEDLYQDDPSLPAGKIKQVDFKAWGAKAAFDYRVKRGEELLQNRTFYSIYRPWQAVFLRGIAPN